MDIDNLKTTWQKISGSTEKRSIISTDELENMLRRKTIDIAGKIRKNIKIGSLIIACWIAVNIIANIITSPLLDKYFDKKYTQTDFFVFAFALELAVYAALLLAITLMWVRYRKIENNSAQNTVLQNRLQLLIGTLQAYKKMFYIILGIVLFYVLGVFTSGFVLGFMQNIEPDKTDGVLKWLITIGAFIVSAGLILMLYYYLFNLFFKRLYGKYLTQLKETLNELNETGH